MAKTDDEISMRGWVKLGTIALGICAVLIAGIMFAKPKYNVYHQEMEGKAALAKAESERQVQIEDAKGKELAAKYLADAEIERARGVAQANKIIGDSLKNNPEYLTYLWIMQVNADGNSVIYIPTEAGIPILEAGKRIGTPKPEPKK